MSEKKRKLDNRAFQDNWTTDYGFVEKKDRAVCAFCCESVVCRTSSVQRHFQTKHQSKFTTPEERSEAIKKAISGFKKQTGILSQAVGTKNKATECSYKIAQCVALKGKPFTDGEYIKEIFVSSAEILFSDLPNKESIMSRIKEIPVSARSIERRISDLAEHVTVRQTNGLTQSTVFSVAVDESTDVNDLSRLAVVTRYCENNRIYEELCCLLSLENTTKSEDILTEFISYFKKHNIDLNKLFCVTTDGAAAMVGRKKGFVKLLENHIGRKLLSFHCIIHQESLCAKTSSLDLGSVMTTVVKIVNYLVSHSSLIHRQFKSLLQEIDCEYGDLLLHSNVRWLSRGKVLTRFVNCYEAIKIFLDEKKQHFPELNDTDWLLKLMFLTDINTHLTELNLKLQGQGQTVLDLFGNWKAFILKLDIFSRDISSKVFKYFPNVKTHSDRFVGLVNTGELQEYLETLKAEFAKRSQDFNIHGSLFSYLIKPDLLDLTTTQLELFNWMNVDDFEMQLVEFKSSELWTSKFVELRKSLEDENLEKSPAILGCWTSLPNSFMSLKKVALALLSAFGSTYSCEQIFSHMKAVLSPNRSRLTPEHSENCVKIKVTQYIPDFEQLTKNIQGQGSH
jgi:hypothetical protein